MVGVDIMISIECSSAKSGMSLQIHNFYVYKLYIQSQIIKVRMASAVKKKASLNLC